MYKGFKEDIDKFNRTYGIKEFKGPTDLGCDRLVNFKNILQEELNEYEDIRDLYSTGEGELEILTAVSDWLGDIIVYVASEAKRWGLPIGDILKIIMESNYSKLDSEGNPIIDGRGKVLKGPNYWKPEPKIKELLLERLK